MSGRSFHNMPNQDDLPPFFRNFPMPQMPDDGPSQGLGSGFIVSPDGIVLTNAHVVDGAETVIVALTDKREYTAKVLGKDKTTDIAVLKIDAKDLPVVAIGDPPATRVGEWVVAIGAPFGLDNTVTAGIVSAKGRSLPGDAAVPFIQTDAAVNPGNSGGPLFNLKGEVIGINSQIFSRSGGFQGLAFAIPIDVAMDVKDQIARNGKVSHGRLGVSIQEVNQSLAETFGLPKPGGALVGSVVKDGPAAKAGIEAGDVILKFDGKPISRSADLPPMVAKVKPGLDRRARDLARRQGAERLGEDRRDLRCRRRRRRHGHREPGQAGRRGALALPRGAQVGRRRHGRRRRERRRRRREGRRAPRRCDRRRQQHASEEP